MSSNPSGTAARAATEWVVLDAIRAHHYHYSNKGSKPDDPGWHVCSCGWEGYWCDWQPHVAERITEALASADMPRLERVMERVHAKR